MSAAPQGHKRRRRRRRRLSVWSHAALAFVTLHSVVTFHFVVTKVVETFHSWRHTQSHGVALLQYLCLDTGNSCINPSPASHHPPSCKLQLLRLPSMNNPEWCFCSPLLTSFTSPPPSLESPPLRPTPEHGGVPVLRPALAHLRPLPGPLGAHPQEEDQAAAAAAPLPAAPRLPARLPTYYVPACCTATTLPACPTGRAYSPPPCPRFLLP